MSSAITAMRERPWIPPSGLISAHLAFGASWILLWELARQHILTASMRAFAWIHLVALGWLSLVALSVLLFVVPQFTEVKWSGEVWARLGIVAFALGTFAMVVAFWTAGYAWLWIASLVVVSGLGLYVAAAMATLSAVLRGKGTEAAIARAFVAVFSFLGAAALVGLAMARSFAGSNSQLLTPSTSTHANLATIGWLTLLVMGVSARTIGPITGHRSPRRWVHISSAGLVTLGALALGMAPWTNAVVAQVGVSLCVVGLGLYVFDMLALVATATVRHRPPQAFVAAGVIWLLVACVLGIAIAAGGARFEAAYIFVGLVGWVGQMVTAHLHHIGVRLIATVARGDDDETPPEALLHSWLSWLTFILFQGAVGIACFSLIFRNAPALADAALIGLLGWIAMTINMIRSILVARSLGRHVVLAH